MAKVLQNFLIGVGLDTEKYDKGAKNVEGSLSRMRTLTTFTGAAMVGAFGLAGTAAVNAGKRVHEFNNAAEKLKTPTEYVHNYGRALAALGGNAEEAIASIGSLEARLAEMRAGGTGRFAGDTDLALAGVDIWPLRDAQTGEEFLRELARQVPDLNQEQQLRVQQTLGLSDVVMISVKDGVEAFDAGIARAGELYGEFGRATDEAREFVRVMAGLNTQIGGISESLAEKMLPAFTGVLRSTSDFISENRGAIDRLLDHAAENPAATAAVTGGAAAAATGAGLRMIGLRTAGITATRFGLPGMAIGSGLLAADAAKDWDWADWWDQSKDSARDSWRGITRQDDYSRLPDVPYGSEVPIVDPGSTVSREPAHGKIWPINQLNTHTDIPEQHIVDPLASGAVTPFQVPENRGSDASALVPMPDPYQHAEPITYEPHIEVGAPEYPQVPVYHGGEVSNVEAANASPDVIMVKDQRQQVDAPVTPPRLSVDNNLDIQLEIDGRAIDTRVVDVIERRERDAADDIYSSVDR